jgi:radical SAM superfamily enzyme YgiQ (UPF0313 family)
MKALLVNPETPATFWSFKHALKFLSKEAALPPLGLLTVAAMMPKSWEKRLIDMATTTLRDQDIRWADYVFISAMFVQRKSVRQVIDKCKNLGTKVVAGGPLFTSVPEYYLDADHLVLNEAEITLPLFLSDLEKGDAGRMYRTRKRADMSETPIPLWELVQLENYAVMPIQYSRGCPFDCEFCDVTALFGHRMRTKTREQMLAELDTLYSMGWRGRVFIVDDNFIANKAKLKTEILPAIIEWAKEHRYPFAFNTQASIDIADDEKLMNLMTRAGFDCVFIGIETPSQEGLDECNKAQNKGRDMVACIKKIQAAGIEVQGGFILGFDSDTPAIFENLTRFIQQSGVVTAMIGLLNAPRGTRLYKRLMAENRLITDSSGDNTDLSMNFVPRMTLGELLEGYRKVTKTLYSPGRYYDRVMILLRNYKPLSTARIGFSPNYIRAFLRSVWRFGVTGRNRLQYWKLIIWSLRSPRYFHLAVRLTIYGYHFRKTFAA